MAGDWIGEGGLGRRQGATSVDGLTGMDTDRCDRLQFPDGKSHGGQRLHKANNKEGDFSATKKVIFAMAEKRVGGQNLVSFKLAR